MTYTGAPCGAHLSEFNVDRKFDGDGRHVSSAIRIGFRSQSPLLLLTQQRALLRS